MQLQPIKCPLVTYCKKQKKSPTSCQLASARWSHTSFLRGRIIHWTLDRDVGQLGRLVTISHMTCMSYLPLVDQNWWQGGNIQIRSLHWPAVHVVQCIPTLGGKLTASPGVDEDRIGLRRWCNKQTSRSSWLNDHMFVVARHRPAIIIRALFVGPSWHIIITLQAVGQQRGVPGSQCSEMI